MYSLNFKYHYYFNRSLINNYYLKEVLMNLMMFLLAGYETTSVTLAILTHLLAQHPDEMHKLQAELEPLTIVRN